MKYDYVQLYCVLMQIAALFLLYYNTSFQKSKRVILVREWVIGELKDVNQSKRNFFAQMKPPILDFVKIKTIVSLCKHFNDSTKCFRTTRKNIGFDVQESESLRGQGIMTFQQLDSQVHDYRPKPPAVQEPDETGICTAGEVWLSVL